MAKYIYRRPDNTKAEKYTPSSDAMNYEVNSKTYYRNFNSKHKYTYKIKSIYPVNFDKLIKNKVRNLKELQRIRNHLFNSLKSDERTENVYEVEYSRQPTYARRYNVLQKSGTLITKQWRNIKFHKPSTPVFAVNKLNPFSENRAKRDNDSKSRHFVAKILNQPYIDKFNQISKKTPKKLKNVPTTTIDSFKPFLGKSFFDIIPRRDFDLRALTAEEKEFNPYSKPYKFVSNYSHCT